MGALIRERINSLCWKMVMKQLVARSIPPCSTRRPASYTRDLIDTEGDVMKRQAFMILTTLSFLVMLAATSVYAQFSNVQVAKIPFEFVIGNKAYPAGEYN